MNTLSLKYFIAVAEFSSFTKASERIFVSQPTLSRQVHDLEESLGVQLFIRRKNALTLTGPGRRLLDEAKEIVKRCDSLKEVVRQETDDVAGSLSIGYQAFLDTKVMYAMMKSVTRKNPGIDFVLSRGTPPELKHNLLFGTCDVIFTLRTCISSTAHVDAIRIAENRLQVAVPRDHRLAERGTIDLPELMGEHLIMLEHRVSPSTVDYVTGLCMKKEIPPQFTYYVDNAETALFLVGTGKGITFVHSQMNIDMLDDADAIKVLDVNGLDDELDYVLAYRSDSVNPLVSLFVSELTGLGAM
jgi:DNA-binding transcriptional LysR family regulator